MAEEQTAKCLFCSYIGGGKVKLCARCRETAWETCELCGHLRPASEPAPPRRCEVCQAEIDRDFEDFWRHIVCDESGELDAEKVKAELFDFRRCMSQVAEVYDYITGGRLSKPKYLAEVEHDRRLDGAVREASEEQR